MDHSIEAEPLELLTDDQASEVLALVSGVENVVRNSTAIAILIRVATETLLAGESRVSHNAFQRRCGVCRRTVDTAIKILKRFALIERVGSTETGSAIYRANFDAGRGANGVV